MSQPVAIITGASRGIGAAAAILLAERGFSICVNYLNAKEKAEEVVNAIKHKNGKAIAIKADMGNENEIMRLFADVDAALGPVSALVNNAGINGGSCDLASISFDTLHSVFAINVFGTFIACREAIKRMKQLNGGSVVNVTSEAAKFGGTRITHYAASKAAINTMTIGLAREVAPFNIKVNAVSPGVIDTDMHHAASPDRIENLLKSLPMGRMGKTEEVAELIGWLLSPQSSYVSGAIIPITGSR